MLFQVKLNVEGDRYEQIECCDWNKKRISYFCRDLAAGAFTVILRLG